MSGDAQFGRELWLACALIAVTSDAVQMSDYVIESAKAWRLIAKYAERERHGWGRELWLAAWMVASAEVRDGAIDRAGELETALITTRNTCEYCTGKSGLRGEISRIVEDAGDDVAWHRQLTGTEAGKFALCVLPWSAHGVIGGGQ